MYCLRVCRRCRQCGIVVMERGTQAKGNESRPQRSRDRRPEGHRGLGRQTNTEEWVSKYLDGASPA